MAIEALHLFRPAPPRSVATTLVSSDSYSCTREFIRERLRNQQWRLAEDKLGAFIRAGLDSGDVQLWNRERIESIKQSLRDQKTWCVALLLTARAE